MELWMRGKSRNVLELAVSGEILNIIPLNGCLLCQISDNLPNPSLITEPAKTADMMSIFFQGLCGKDDFMWRRD
jgi:hypothetical protein